MTPTFSLAIPHTPWVPERVESLRKLGLQLGPTVEATVFKDKEPNWSWSAKMWSWGAKTGTTYLVQLQDDVEVAPNFWAALSAMVTALPDQIIGLQGAHPKFRSLARDEHRWAKSAAWMVGVGWVMPTHLVKELSEWRETIPESIYTTANEDDLIGRFAVESARCVFHPIPTIIDHTPIPSTYGNDTNKFQRPTVTWREFGANEITRPEFWAVSGMPPMVSSPHETRCWGCEQEPGLIGFPSGGVIGRSCLAGGVAGALRVRV